MQTKKSIGLLRMKVTQTDYDEANEAVHSYWPCNTVMLKFADSPAMSLASSPFQHSRQILGISLTVAHRDESTRKSRHTPAQQLQSLFLATDAKRVTKSRVDCESFIIGTD